MRLRGVALLGGMLLLAPILAAAAQANAAGTPDLPPPGYGSLTQDEVAIRLVSTANDVDVRILPLDERLLRLLAPDAYASLHRLVASRQRAIDSIGGANGVSTPGLMLVTFFGLRPDARFDPQDLSLVIRNRFYRPLGVVPFTGNFNSRQLSVRQAATAIYLFEEVVPVFEPFGVAYQAVTSNAWESTLSRVERERVRVATRVRRERPDTATRE